MIKKLWVWGLAATVVYTLIFSIFVAQDFVVWKVMKLNELGDFLAGVFGPLAFLWLVLGFVQQGTELKISSDALRLQAEELKNSVEQQKSLVKLSTEQLLMSKKNTELEHERLLASLEPKFAIQYLDCSDSGTDVVFQFDLANGGHLVTCLDVARDGEVFAHFPIFDHGTTNKIRLKINKPQRKFCVELVVTYLNGLEVSSSKKFDVGFYRGLDENARWVANISQRQGVKFDAGV
ncbi:MULTISPECIES: hypothetical protein [unclassified Pseudomonas]|uniref:hypothetical protein n=1 Tax=unclassified Pseudomonas TaxID=196821 RepID=UPI00161E6A2A|nr:MULTISPECIES: hypothetical protein [unclassified Pseudomonas]MBB6287681.1 hypothetical protein [Pseudomonas sp. SJZ073]MBB6310391.1 hypothetical protein [Pseudomonas sp. JAI120]